MYHPDQLRETSVDQPVVASPVQVRGCLVEGCPCRDARIVSHRRAAFFAFLARQSGETADRVIAVDSAWSVLTGGMA